MDGSNLEHSDSDSGESWTLLENTPSYADDVPDVVENLPHSADTTLYIEKDEDTDGISIISDSDPESPTPCDLKFDRCILDEDPPTGHKTHDFVSKTHPPNSNNGYESMKCEDFLGDGKCKLRTYVHKRNQRLSTVLNIIVLGSVITAAGVAIGHMWGVRHDCSVHTTPSVNKILSNLYKLQEENAYLRSKLKELTILNNLQVQHKKFDSDKDIKHRRCKKVFEESLSNKHSGALTKCVEHEIVTDKVLESHLVEPEYEKELLNDLDKLKSIYQQNKSWLDIEIARRIKHENESTKRLQRQLHNIPQAEKQEFVNKPVKLNITANLSSFTDSANSENDVNNNDVPEKIVTYADSLKSVAKAKQKEQSKIDLENTYRRHNRKKRLAKERDIIFVHSASEEDIKKDDRYTSHRYKIERKKNDRQKSNKKQKRKNKYEQWEMKGGYLKDYDEFTLTSSQDNIYMNVPMLRSPSIDISPVVKRNHHLNKVTETKDENNKTKKDDDEAIEHKTKQNNRLEVSKRGKSSGKNKDFNWYEKRVALRMEARKKLEKELFEESVPNTAGWYFRRMQRREQCRFKGDNGTYRKHSKRAMNYKTKT